MEALTLSPAQARTIYFALYLAATPEGQRPPTFDDDAHVLQGLIADLYRLPWAAGFDSRAMQTATVGEAVQGMRENIGMTDEEIRDPQHLAFVAESIAAYEQGISELREAGQIT